MKILFISPYPPSRIRVRGYHFIQYLRRDHALTLLVQVSSERELQDVALLKQQGYEVVAVPVSKPTAWLHSLAALPGTYPLQVAHARSPRFLQEARRLLAREHFDLVHVEHLRGMASMLPLLGSCPLIWDAVDCISSLWMKTMKGNPELRMRLLASVEYKRTQAFERHLLRCNTHVLAISQADRTALLDLALARHTDPLSLATIDVVSNGVDRVYFAPGAGEYRPFNIVFSGKMSYHANVAAALYLCREIMPLIWEVKPEVTVTIVGSDPPPAIQALSADPRVEVTGYVYDIRPYIRHAHVMMSPTVYSVGLQNKVLEAMALGTPTILSEQSAEALELQSGYHAYVARTPLEFADYALRVMSDSELRRQLSVHGSRYVEEHHDWEMITEHLVSCYHRAIAFSEQKTIIAEPAHALHTHERLNL